MEMGIKEIVRVVIAIIVLFATVGIIIFLFKGKGGNALDSIRRVLKFG